MLTGCRYVDLNPDWYPVGAGRDARYICAPNGKFHIYKAADVYVFGVNTDREYDFDDSLLANVDYFSKNNRLYVYSCEGYAVVDEVENTAQVLRTSEPQYFTNCGTDDKAVTYLTSFDEFSKEDQEILSKMERIGGKTRKERKFGIEYISVFGKLIPTN